MLMIGGSSRLALVALAMVSVRGGGMFEIRPQDRYEEYDFSRLTDWPSDAKAPITYGPPRKGKRGKPLRW